MSNKTSNYIEKCWALGITNHEEICNRALSRLAEIDIILAKADELRIEKVNLKEVLSGLGVEENKNQDPIKLDLDENSEEFVLLRQKICEEIEKAGSLTNREIISRVGSYQEDHKVIRAVKNLGTKEIIQRNKNLGNVIVPGPKWEERENILKS